MNGERTKTRRRRRRLGRDHTVSYKSVWSRDKLTATDRQTDRERHTQTETALISGFMQSALSSSLVPPLSLTWPTLVSN